MKTFLLFAVAGPVLVLTKLGSIRDPELLKRLASLGKFIAYELPVESVKASYSAHFQHILTDPKQTDELRILDTDSKQIFTNIDFKALGQPLVHQPGR
jgi:hypothetical protein